MTWLRDLCTSLATIILRVAMAVDELPEAFSFLDSVQILALDILDQRDLGRGESSISRTIAGIVCSLRPLRRPPAAFASDNLETIAMWAKQDRLQNPALDKGVGELLDSLFLELHARLVGIGPNSADFDLAHTAGPSCSSCPTARHALAHQAAPGGLCRAPIPAYWCSCRLSVAWQASHQLARQMHIGLGSGAFQIVDQRRQPVAGRLRQANVPRNHGIEHRPAQTGPHVVRDLLGQLVAPIEHGQRNPEDLTVRD